MFGAVHVCVCIYVCVCVCECVEITACDNYSVLVCQCASVRLTGAGSLLLDDGQLHVLDLDPDQEEVDLAHHNVPKVVSTATKAGIT